MRHAWISLLILTLVSTLSLGCGQAGGGTAESGHDSSKTLLEMLPREASGVFFVDIQKAMTVPAAQKALAENHEKLDEFIADTGIDPTRDLLRMAGAVTNQARGEETDGVAVMDVRVDAAALIKKIEAERGELGREEYEGVAIVVLPPEDGNGKEVYLAFLDENTLTMGTPLEVRTVIDVHQKRGESVLQNAELMAIVQGTDQNSMFWAAFVFTEEEMAELTGNDPMMSSLSGLQSVRMSFDYRDKMLTALIECQGQSEEQNQQIADFLTGIKSFAAMGASERPELGELLRTIEITSGPRIIRVSADIPEDLLERLETSEKKRL